jgi:predicted Zn-dependent protease
MVRLLVCLIAIFSIFESRNSNAATISIINDLEIEDMILSITKPIFKVAGLDQDEIKVYVISDPGINAFAYYNKIFVHTGLVVFSNTSSAMFGVLSHETGHVARKHLTRMIVRSSDDMERYGRASLLLAALLIVITPAAATAALQSAILTPAIGLAAIMQNKLRYSRENEVEADESAILYLSRLNKPLAGLYDTMMFFHQSMPNNSTIYKYTMTHPLPEERLDRFQIATRDEGGKIFQDDCDIEMKLRRSQAKIFGYLDDGQYEVKYPVDRPHRCFTKQDLEFFVKYKDIYEHWKDRKYSKALKLTSRLLADRPNDVFLTETKSLLLFHNGNTDEAIECYRKVIEVVKTNSATFNLAYHLSASPKKEHIEEAVRLLKQIVEEEKNPAYYSQLAQAYQKMGDNTSFFVYMAEANFYAQNFPLSLSMAEKAIDAISRDTQHADRAFLENKARDIKDAILSKSKPKRRKRAKKFAT